MSGQKMNYSASLNCPTKPILLSELPNVKIDYNGLLEYARQKGVRVIELSEEERNQFVTPLD